MILRCTHRLLKGSGIELTPDPPPESAALAEWFANAVPLPFAGRSVVMYTNARTLLTVVASGRAVRTTLPAFRDRLPKLLARLGVAPEWIREQTAALEPVHFTRTNDRRVLGSMNELAYGIWFEALDVGSYDRLDFDQMELRLAETPLSLLPGYESPDLVTRAVAVGKPPSVLRSESIAELRRRSDEYRKNPHNVIPADQALADIERSLA